MKIINTPFKQKWNHKSRDENGNKTRLYERWTTMKARVNPNRTAKNHRFYREKGIKICNEWLNYDNFADWALLNGFNENLTLDRIDDDKDYMPSNCRWISLSENVRQRNLKYDYTKANFKKKKEKL